MEIDPRVATPVYVQLAAILREAIASGEIAAGHPIPSKAQLRARYGISSETVNKAVDLLRADGMLRLSPGKGLYVVPAEEREG
jgi:GntR family transcriptional regulator